MAVYSSRLPPISELPEVSIWNFLFSSVHEETGAYVDGLTGEKIEQTTLKHLSQSLAFALIHRLGLKQGDTVLLFLENSIFFPVIVLAIQAAGLICCPTNSAYQATELTYQIVDSGAKVVITNQTRLPVALLSCKEAKVDRLFIVEKDSAHNIASIWSLVDGSQLQPVILNPEEAKQNGALLCYSSGTSGVPKGVKLTHYNLTSAILQAIALAPSSFGAGEVWIATLPLAHIYALFLHVFVAQYIRAKVVVFRQFSQEHFASAIQFQKATACHIVPPIAIKLVKDINRDSYNFPCLREWRSAAAPLGQDLTKALEERWNVPLEALYGMTEATAVISLTSCDTPIKKPGSVGLLGPNMYAKIVDGELCLKGPNIMGGYHNRPDINAEVFDDDGFMHTGDIVRIDEDGCIFVVDRVKELIKYNGFQVAPAELEDLLLKHQDVKDSAVVGVEVASQGTEYPIAYVVLTNPPSPHDLRTLKSKWEELLSYVEIQVAYFKKLRGGIIFVTSIPKSPSGKIMRRQLRVHAQKHWIRTVDLIEDLDC